MKQPPSGIPREGNNLGIEEIHYFMVQMDYPITVESSEEVVELLSNHRLLRYGSKECLRQLSLRKFDEENRSDTGVLHSLEIIKDLDTYNCIRRQVFRGINECFGIIERRNNELRTSY